MARRDSLAITCALLGFLGGCAAAPNRAQISAGNPPPAGYVWQRTAFGVYRMTPTATCLGGHPRQTRLAVAARTDKSAFERLRTLARHGNPQAAFAVGALLAGSVPPGAPGTAAPAARRAVVWYRRAAREGSIRAEVALVYADQAGQGGPIDIAQANREFARLQSQAQHGNTKAEQALAALYQAGTFVAAPDPAMAFRWWQRAAGQGSQRAALMLYGFYTQGEKGTVAPNPAMAAYWRRKLLAEARRCHSPPITLPQPAANPGSGRAAEKTS
ncbi:MAG: tetratricopeptide repeat protein [Acetobacteraceae bacterium]